MAIIAMALLDPYTGPWTSDQAAHLARRTTFGATPVQLAALTAAGMSAAVDSIVDYAPVDLPLENRIVDLPSGTTEYDRIKNPVSDRDVEGWWLYRMVHSTQPFQQQFALFLHDHFVSEWDKIFSTVTPEANNGNDGSIPGQSCIRTSGSLPADPNRRGAIAVRLMRDQHNIFLTLGHGAFKSLLVAITRDPCMLIYLDNRTNFKTRPQENFAREIMELFSMGVGNYNEQDVKEIARALTGESVNTSCLLNWPYSYFYAASSHDTNPKTVFGVTFNSSVPGEDTNKVIDLILQRVSNSTVSPNHAVYPAASLYMSWKFLTWFVNQGIAISDEAVKELADFFYNNTSAGGYRYNVRETLRLLFKSSFFYESQHRFKLFKNPAEYVVTALRALELDDPSYAGNVNNWVREMGMKLFDPPTVDGWAHGHTWINASGVVARFNYANRMSTSVVLSDTAIDSLIEQHIHGYDDDAGIASFFASRLLLDSLTFEEADIFMQLFKDIKGSATTTTQSIYRKKVRAALHLTMTMPRYQLK